jgi:RNA polymerase sigma factor (sigma-70 family)
VADRSEPLPEHDQFAESYRRFERRLAFLARQRGIPPDDCDDLVHEVFTRALAGYHRGALRDEDYLAGWIFGIFANVVADYWRTHERRDRLAPTTALTDLIPSRAPGPEAHLRVQQALSRLPARHRFALVLNTMAGLTTEEIAPLLRRSPGRVGAILAEAKHLFRLHYSGAEEGPRRRRLKR